MPDEKPTFAADDAGDAVLDDLRRQLDLVKARMAEHRTQLQAAGLTPPPSADSGDL